MYIKFEKFIKEDLVFRGINYTDINSTYGGSDKDMGEFWTDNLTMANWFAGLIEYDSIEGEYVKKHSSGNIIKREINLKNPHIINEKHPYYDADNGHDSFQIYMDDISKIGVEKYKQSLIESGHDGIILENCLTNYYEDGDYTIFILF